MYAALHDVLRTFYIFTYISTHTDLYVGVALCLNIRVAQRPAFGAHAREKGCCGTLAASVMSCVAPAAT